METPFTSGVLDVRFLKSRVVRAESAGSSTSNKDSGVVDKVSGRKRLAGALVGVSRTVVVSSTGSAVVVVVVVGLAGRLASNPANPLVDATVASVDEVAFEADGFSSTSAGLDDSMVTARAVVVRVPGRRPLMILATAADPVPAFDSIRTGASVVVVVLTDGRRARRPASPPGVDGVSTASVGVVTVVGTSSSDASSFDSTASRGATVVVVVRTPGRRPLTRLAKVLLAVATGTAASVSVPFSDSVMARAVVVRPAPGLRPPKRPAIPFVALLVTGVSFDVPDVA